WAADLRVHRAGVEPALYFRGRPVADDEAPRRLPKFRAAAFAAEEVHLARILFPDGRVRGHLHPAHGVELSWLGLDLEISIAAGIKVVHGGSRIRVYASPCCPTGSALTTSRTRRPS